MKHSWRLFAYFIWEWRSFRQLMARIGLLLLVTPVAWGLSCPKAQSAFRSMLKVKPVSEKENPSTLSEKVVDFERIKSVVIAARGSAVKKNKALSDLPDGTYVYMINDSALVAILPRTMDPAIDFLRTGISQPDKFVGSHLGLKKFFEKMYPESNLMASGELLIRDGQAFTLTNGAGTFPGGKVNLVYATDVFKAVGLKITKNTRILDYSSGEYADPHEAAPFNARLEIEIKADPIRSRMLKDMKAVFKKFYSSGKSFSQLFDYLKKDDNLDLNLVYPTMYLVEAWDKGIESDVWLVDRYNKSYSQETYYKVLQIINTYSEL